MCLWFLFLLSALAVYQVASAMMNVDGVLMHLQFDSPVENVQNSLQHKYII